MEGSTNNSAPPRASSSPPPTQQQEEQHPNISTRVSISLTERVTSAEGREDVWSCFVILLTFWFFASMTVILGFYGSVDLLVGPNCSRLLQANSFFVQDIKVKAGGGSNQERAVLYGFFKPPPLEIKTAWSETHNASILPNFHKEWMYYLNSGARVDISYRVKSHGSDPLIVIIARGKESLIQWIEDPLNPNTTLSWNSLHGNGMIQQNIEKPSDYYVAVANLNHLEMEVQLNFRIQTLLYNTTGAYYKCSLDHGPCNLYLFLLRTNVGILTSGPEQDGESDEWYVNLSYGPRWFTYFVGSGVMTLLILLAFKILTSLQFGSGHGDSRQAAGATTERSPLLANKDDDNSSLGSSYDSVSHDEEDIEEWPGVASKLVKEGDTDNASHLCAVCCDAQRDCFFLPCGHCATCFTCGTRITNEEDSACPICRRKIKKVRMIFTV